MIVNPGEFKRKIKIIRRILNKDDDGFLIPDEEIMLTAWAKVENQSGKEIRAANSDFAEVTTRFFMRTPLIEIRHDWEILFNNRYYNILYVNDYSYGGICTEIIAKLVKK